MAKCLVTGGLGFIGRHLVRRLVCAGHSVVILDDGSASAVGLEFLVSRLVCERFLRHSTRPTTEYAPFDVIFHLAAVSRTPPAIADPVRCNEVNVGLTLDLLEYARSYPCSPRFVHSSSNVVYGSPTPYRASKLAAEFYLESYNALYSANAIALRYSNVIGPGLRPGDPAVLSSLRDCRAANGYVEVTGDGGQTRNFTYVEDIVEANLLAAFASSYKGVLDVSTGVQTTMNEFAGHFDCPVHYIDDRRGDTKHIHQPVEGGTVPSAQAILGWQPRVPFDEAMRRSLVEANA